MVSISCTRGAGHCWRPSLGRRRACRGGSRQSGEFGGVVDRIFRLSTFPWNPQRVPWIRQLLVFHDFSVRSYDPFLQIRKVPLIIQCIVGNPISGNTICRIGQY